MRPGGQSRVVMLKENDAYKVFQRLCRKNSREYEIGTGKREKGGNEALFLLVSVMLLYTVRTLICPLSAPKISAVQCTVCDQGLIYRRLELHDPRSNQHPPQSLGASKHSSPCDRTSPLATLPFTRSFTGAFLSLIATRTPLRLFVITYDLLFPRRTSALTGHEIQLALVLTVQPVEDAHIAEHIPRLAGSRVNERAHADRTSICA